MQQVEIDDNVPLPGLSQEELSYPTVDDVMKRWNCSSSNVYQHHRAGNITIFHIGIGTGSRVAGVIEFEQRRLAEAKARQAERLDG